MTYVLLAHWTAAEGNEDRVGEILRRLVGPSRAEPGCRTFRPHRSLDDRRRFVIYEEYDDEAAFAAHGDSPHFRELVLEQAIPLLEERSRTFYAPIGS
jgi:quinol monooxygenase YgiN